MQSEALARSMQGQTWLLTTLVLQTITPMPSSHLPDLMHCQASTDQRKHSKSGQASSGFLVATPVTEPHTHIFKIGVATDHKAWQLYGNQLQGMVEDIVGEASMVYEAQMNLSWRLPIFKSTPLLTRASSQQLGSPDAAMATRCSRD